MGLRSSQLNGTTVPNPTAGFIFGWTPPQSCLRARCVVRLKVTGERVTWRPRTRRATEMQSVHDRPRCRVLPGFHGGLWRYSRRDRLDSGTGSRHRSRGTSPTRATLRATEAGVRVPLAPRFAPQPIISAAKSAGKSTRRGSAGDAETARPDGSRVRPLERVWGRISP